MDQSGEKERRGLCTSACQKGKRSMLRMENAKQEEVDELCKEIARRIENEVLNMWRTEGR